MCDKIVINQNAKQERINQCVNSIVEHVKELASKGIDRKIFLIPRDIRIDVMEILEDKYNIYRRTLSEIVCTGDRCSVSLTWG